MQILQISLLILVFIVMALLMFFRKIPALIALPLMAFFIAIIGGVTLTDTIEYVLGEGVMKLSTAYTIAIFGSILSVILQKTGVAENFIKKGAELSGDNPWVIALVMLLLITMLFTTLGGLGAIIMVATIVLPIMSSVGIGALTTAGIFLIGLSIGGILNVGNWAVYISVMGLETSEIRGFALIMFGLSLLTALVYITIQLFRDGQNLDIKKIMRRTVLTVLTAAGLTGAFYYWIPESMKEGISGILGFAGVLMKYLTGIGITVLFAAAVYRAALKKNEREEAVHWITFFSPLIPLLLILVFNLNFIAAFITGIIYTFTATYKSGRLNLFIRSVFEGGAVVMPAVVLMFGIGMLLIAIMGPGRDLAAYPEGWPVLNLLKPLMLSIVPENPVTYVVFFTLFAPLALYRGPLNVWGMGYGLAAVFLAAGLNPGAVMGLLMAVGQIQGISDPTNTHNVWLANEMRVDVQKILWNTIPYTWIIACAGLIISALLFM